MTAAQAVGAASSEAAEWYAIHWPTIQRNVRRLQVRIAQATKEGSWGRVRGLQRLLPHSFSGKVLAVRRVTENAGKKTPGVDQEIGDTPEKKIQALHALKRRGYQPQPLRRMYIPKSDGKTMRPLGIPTMKDRAMKALNLFDFAPFASGSRPYGSSYSPKVAEIRIYGKARHSRNNGWNATRRYYLSRALELRTGWTGTTPEGKVPNGNTSPVSGR